MESAPRPAPEPPSRLRHVLLVVVPLGVILAVVAIAYVLYTRHREQYFTQRYVRALAAFAEQTEGAVDGLDSAVNQAEKEWTNQERRKWEHPSPTPDAARNPEDCPLVKPLSEQLAVVPIKLSAAPPLALGHRPLGQAPGVLAHAKLNRLQQSDTARRQAPTTIEHPPVETADSTLYFCRETPKWVQGAPRGTCDWFSKSTWWCAEEDFAKLLQPLLDGSALEHLDLFIVDEGGNALYERGNSGLRLAALAQRADASAAGKDTAPTPPPRLPSLAEVMGSTLVREVEVDGTPYKLFSQPLRLRADDDTQYKTWAVGVLVPLDGMQGDTQRMPLAVMAGVPLLCLLSLLALPFLQVLTAGPREALTRYTVYGAALSLVVATALVTLGLLDWYAYASVGAQVEDELREVARALQGNFQQELRAAHDVLVSFRDERLRARPEDDLQTGYTVCEQALSANGACYPSGRKPEGLAPTLTEVFKRYPAFDILVLAGRDGWQREKWTTATKITPVYQMNEEGPFIDVKQGRLRSLIADGSVPDAAGPDHTFALNVMTSPNTGKVLTVLSVPIAGPNEDEPLRGVAMMIPKLLSLVDPVVPPDVGFAVIDNNGRVIFHSQQRRRLYENFFAEAAGELPLRSAVFARRAGFFDLDYHGRPQHAFVQPLRDTAWSLVVFRSKDALRTFNFEAVSEALLCFLGCVALYLLWLAVARALLGPGLASSFWPDPHCMTRYQLLSVALLLLAAWSGWTLFTRNGVDTVLAAIVTPLSALGMVVVVLTTGRTRSAWGWLLVLAASVALLAVTAALADSVGGWMFPAGIGALLLINLASSEPGWLPRTPPRHLRAAYVGMLVALLVNLAVLPMAALFEDAFDLGVEAVSRARQLKLAEAMAKHALRLQDEYRDIPNAKEALDFWRTSRWDRAWSASPSIAHGPAPAAPAHPTAASIPAAGTAPAGSGVARWRVPWFPELCPDATLDGRDATCGTAAALSAPDDLTAERCGVLGRHPTGAVALSLPMYGQDALELRQTVYTLGSDCSWGPAADAGALSVQPPFAALIGELPQAYPALQADPTWPAFGIRWAVFGGIAGAFLITLWMVLRWLTARIFCLGAWETCVGAVDAAAVATGGYYVRPPALVFDHLVAQVRAAGGAVVDLGMLGGPAELPGRVAHCGSGRVLIANLEHRLDDLAWNKQKLATLEELVLRRALHVDVTSEIDVLPYFTRRLNSDADPADATYPSADEMARWARVLARLDKQCADLPSAPLPPRPGESETLHQECRWTSRLCAIEVAVRADPRWTSLSPGALIRHVGELADAYYRTLWASLTDEERLVLYHLATRGFVNPKQCELARHLMRQGLIRRGPALRLMNESFRQFVLSIEDRATIRGWERAAGTSTWQWVRNGVMAVAVVGGVFLFLTQPDAYAKWVGLLAALTTVGGGMSQVLGLFQGTRRPATG